MSRQLDGCYVLATGLLGCDLDEEQVVVAILESAKWGSGSTSALSLLKGHRAVQRDRLALQPGHLLRGRYLRQAPASPVANDITPYASSTRRQDRRAW